MKVELTGRPGDDVGDAVRAGARRPRPAPDPRRHARATLRWGLDDPAVVEGWHDGLRCVDAVRSVELPQVAAEPWSARVPMWVMARLPKVRDVGRVLRYRF